MSAALAGESSCWRKWATKKGTGREDIHLLPLLLAAAHRSHKGGAFLEIGALNGVEASQTMLLEKCYHWPGLLVEGAPGNWARLRVAPRNARKLWSAVGTCGPYGTANISRSGNAGLSTVPRGYPMRGADEGTVEVPCTASLLDLWRKNMPVGQRLTYLSLDVEGAEEQIVKGMLSELRERTPIDIMLIEASTANAVARKQSRAVAELLLSTPYKRLTLPQGMGVPTYSENEVWVAPQVALGATTSAQQLLSMTGHATPRAKAFVEMRHCGWRSLPDWCNTSMRDGALDRLEQVFKENGPF